MSEILFTTVHGSHLYGLNHSGSDRDVMNVFVSSARARHRNGASVGGDDSINVGIYDLISKSFDGAHQFMEGVFSQKKVWADENSPWRPVIEGIRIPAGFIRSKYTRTIKSFVFTDTQKSRQHAVRLGMTLRDLHRFDGIYNPTLSVEDVEKVKRTATDHSGLELFEMIIGDSV